MLVPLEYFCPVCASPIESAADPSQGKHQSYVEDCQVCCRPLMLEITISGEAAFASATPESD